MPEKDKLNTQTSTPQNLSTTVTNENGKPNRKRLVLLIFSVFLLIGAVVAGVILVQQQQELREEASSGSECTHADDCILLEDPGDSGSYEISKPIKKVVVTARYEHPYESAENNDGCYDVRIKTYRFNWDRIGSGPDCKEVSNIQIWTREPEEMNPGCHGTVNCDGWEFYFSHPLDGVATITVKSEGQTVGQGQIGPSTDPTSTITGPWLIQPNPGAEVVFVINYLDKDRTDSKFMPDSCGSPTITPSPTVTPSPSPTPTEIPEDISAICNQVKIYDISWQLLSVEDLKELKAGDTIRLTVAGSTNMGTFEEARFIINGATTDSTSQTRPGTAEFYLDYQIPDGVIDFNVTGQLRHSTLGWF